MEKIIRIQRNEMNHTGIKPSVKGYIVLIVLLCISFRISAQTDYRNTGFSSRRDNFAPSYAYSLDIHFDPVISWFSTNRYLMRNEGAMPGSSIGISRSKNYSPNYSFTSGVSITDAGGKLICLEKKYFRLRNPRHETVAVEAGERIIYRIKYFSVPVGIKLRTGETGYGKIFAEAGLDPKIVLSAKADIPSLNIRDNNAFAEIRAFNLSYHVMAGTEYPVIGNLSAVFGLRFENNFLDFIRNNKNKPGEMVSHKLLSFRLGINF